jgi:hypothetical protein
MSAILTGGFVCDWAGGLAKLMAAQRQAKMKRPRILWTPQKNEIIA